jgi:hypothetical protein
MSWRAWSRIETAVDPARAATPMAMPPAMTAPLQAG